MAAFDVSQALAAQQTRQAIKDREQVDKQREVTEAAAAHQRKVAAADAAKREAAEEARKTKELQHYDTEEKQLNVDKKAYEEIKKRIDQNTAASEKIRSLIEKDTAAYNAAMREVERREKSLTDKANVSWKHNSHLFLSLTLYLGLRP